MCKCHVSEICTMSLNLKCTSDATVQLCKGSETIKKMFIRSTKHLNITKITSNSLGYRTITMANRDAPSRHLGICLNAAHVRRNPNLNNFPGAKALGCISMRSAARAADVREENPKASRQSWKEPNLSAPSPISSAEKKKQFLWC